MEYHLNHIELIGRLHGGMTAITAKTGDVFFDGTFAVQRLSGTFDYLPISIPARLLSIMPGLSHDGVTDLTKLHGLHLRLIGELRTYNKEEQGKSRHYTVLYVKDIKEETQATDDNCVELEGVICRPPVYRETPFGREICDFMIAVDRTCRRSSYIPCIAWGLTGRQVSALEVGAKVKLTGRFQSREYTKVLDNGGMVTRMAYEVSCKRVDEMKVVKEWVDGSR